MLKKLVTTMVLAFLCTPSIWAGECHSERLDASTPTNNFIGQGEIVTDKHTTLSWMRCAVGQQWNGKRCEGEPTTLNWQDAMALVDKLNTEGGSGHHDWRMPLVPELASIVERQCFNPRMNVEVFPGAPSETFWTSMEKMGMPSYAYTLNFGGGSAKASLKDEDAAIRLVRGGPWWKPPAMLTQQ